MNGEWQKPSFPLRTIDNANLGISLEQSLIFWLDFISLGLSVSLVLVVLVVVVIETEGVTIGEDLFVALCLSASLVISLAMGLFLGFKAYRSFWN